MSGWSEGGYGVSGVVEFRTSGSSGKPKVIRKAESMLAADAAMLACHFENEWFAEPAMCRVLTTLSCDYMYGRLWLGQLMPAVGVTDVRRIDGLEALLAEQTAAERVRLLLITTPAFLAEVLEHPLVERVRPIFSAVVTSGSFLSESLAMRVKARFGVAPTEIYGSTETGSVAWRRQDEGAQWTLFPGVNAESTEHGVKVCSPFCLEGTWELRDRVEFEPLNDRRFLLLERLDRRVKVLERWWISLPEVETALRAHPWVNEVAAVPSPGETVRVWALVTLSVKGVAEVSRLGYTKSVRALREALSAGGLHFAGIPRRIRFVPELPYNARGKLPMGVIQATVAQAWQYPLFERTIKRKEVPGVSGVARGRATGLSACMDLRCLWGFCGWRYYTIEISAGDPTWAVVGCMCGAARRRCFFVCDLPGGRTLYGRKNFGSAPCIACWG